MDLDFIAGNFIYGDLPPGKEYLEHYFLGEIDRAFLSYYFLFYRLYTEKQFQVFYQNFCDHTGCSCSTRWVRKLLVRIKAVEKALEEANRNIDLTAIGEIKSGKRSF